MTKDEVKKFLFLPLLDAELFGAHLEDIYRDDTDYIDIISGEHETSKPIVVKLSVPETSKIKESHLKKFFTNITNYDIKNCNSKDYKVNVFKENFNEIWSQLRTSPSVPDDHDDNLDSVRFLCTVIKGKEWKYRDMKKVKKRFKKVLIEGKEKLDKEEGYEEV